MRVTVPVEITAAKIISSNVAEPSPGEVVHSLTDSYLVGDEVINLTTHRKYASLQGKRSLVTLSVGTPCVVTWPGHGLISGVPVVLSTTGALPTGLVAGTTYYALVAGGDTFNLSATAGGAAITTTGSASGQHTASSNVNKGHALPVPPLKQNDWWKEVGVTNRMAAFDLARNSQAVRSGSISYTFAPGERVNTIGVLGMEADEITITATSGGQQVYTYTERLLIREVLDHYMYAYKPFSTRPSVVRFNVPPFFDIVVTVTLTRAVGDVKCGSIIVGTYAYIGDIERNAVSDALNFSTILRDEFAELSELQPRRSVPKTNQNLFLEKRYVREVDSVRQRLNAVPALWTALDETQDAYFDLLLILGIYKQFKINPDTPNYATVTLELEEI